MQGSMSQTLPPTVAAALAVATNLAQPAVAAAAFASAAGF